MTLDVKRCLAPCGECSKKTHHNILYSVSRTTSPDITNRYHLLQCGGCDSVSMAHTYTSPHSKDVTYYPSPVPRVLPAWMFEFEIGLIRGENEQMIGQLLQEVYAAGRGGQYRLATMGIRSVLEHVIIAKVGDHQTFRKNLEQFYDAGYISLVQRDALNDSLEAGRRVGGGEGGRGEAGEEGEVGGEGTRGGAGSGERGGGGGPWRRPPSGEGGREG